MELLRCVHGKINKCKGNKISRLLNASSISTRTRGHCTRRGPLRVKNGNRKVKFGTNTYFAFDPNSPALRFDEMLRNGKPQPRPAGFARTRHIDAVEALENTRLICLRDANPRVFHS